MILITSLKSMRDLVALTTLMLMVLQALKLVKQLPLTTPIKNQLTCQKDKMSPTPLLKNLNLTKLLLKVSQFKTPLSVLSISSNNK